MGSAVVYELARRGKRVLGIDRFDVPNVMGSSHGVTRIIRLAYCENPSYVPLLRRAYELWRELESVTGEEVLQITGSIDAGPPGSVTFEGARRACEEHDIPHEILTSRELSRRFPGYRLPADTMALFQRQGGFLLSERCILNYVGAAHHYGAEVRAREPVLEWVPLGDGVRVGTDHATYEADSLVISAGAWASALVPELKRLALPERQAVAWFEPLRREHFTAERFPVFNVFVSEGRFYGFPTVGPPRDSKDKEVGFKIGCYHHLKEQIDPDHFDRDPNENDAALLREATARYFPHAAGPISSMKTCIFTNSPDEHFIIDLHPQYPQVSVAAGFSGHGFKFCSVVGEIMADLATRRETRHDVEWFRLSRFTA